MKKTSTITDVAKFLNVSVSTVSRVMNGRDRVSSEMRKKVMDAVQKLNYVPNYAAVSIVKKRTNVIVVLVPDLNTPFFLNVVQGVENIAKSHGYFTMVFSTNGSLEEESNFINGIMGRSVDGIIAVPSSPDLLHFEDYDKPIVFVDRFNDNYSYDCVVIDNFKGAYTAVEHLVQMGHKKIAIISGPRELNIGKERYWGYDQAMRDNNLDIKDEYISIGGWSEKDGYDALSRFMRMMDPPTAIFATNENICRGVIKAAHDLNLKFVEDISLISFDDNELAQIVNPQISVVSRATNEMGNIGASILLDKIEERRNITLPQRISLPTQLIVRGSVRKINTKL